MLENYVVIDLEMTGLDAKKDAILEVGAIRVRDGKAKDTYHALLRPAKPLGQEVSRLTGITPEMAEAGEEPESAMEHFFTFLGDDILVGQNVIFDYRFLKQWAVNHGFPFERSAVDTLKLSRQFLPREQKKDLESLCIYFSVEREKAHRALDDARATGLILERLKAEYGLEHAEAFLPYPLQYHPKKQTPATARQIEYIKKYAAYYKLELPEALTLLTRSEASRLVDQWITQYGRYPKGVSEGNSSGSREGTLSV